MALPGWGFIPYGCWGSSFPARPDEEFRRKSAPLPEQAPGADSHSPLLLPPQRYLSSPEDGPRISTMPNYRFAIVPYDPKDEFIAYPTTLRP